MYFISGDTPEIIARNIRELYEKCPSNRIATSEEISCNSNDETVYLYDNGDIYILGVTDLYLYPDGTYEFYGNEV